MYVFIRSINADDANEWIFNSQYDFVLLNARSDWVAIRLSKHTWNHSCETIWERVGSKQKVVLRRIIAWKFNMPLRSMTWTKTISGTQILEFNDIYKQILKYAIKLCNSFAWFAKCVYTCCLASWLRGSRVLQCLAWLRYHCFIHCYRKNNKSITVLFRFRG